LASPVETQADVLVDARHAVVETELQWPDLCATDFHRGDLGEGAAGDQAGEPGGVASPELEQLLAPIDLTVADPAVIAVLEDLLDGEVAVDEGLFADTAKAYGVEMRVVERDGESLQVTADYRTDRINVIVVDGTVVAIDGIG
jgi:hypothetical protein